MTEQHTPAPAKTCPVCKGEKVLEGEAKRMSLEAERLVYAGERAIIECPNCGGAGTVLAEGDLAHWREEVERLLDAFARRVVGSLPRLRTHLAAMPQPSVNATGREALLAVSRLALPMIHEMHLREHPFPERCQPSSAGKAPACPFRDARAAIQQAEAQR